MAFNAERFSKDSAISIERMILKTSISALNDLFGSGVISEEGYKTWLAHYNSKFIKRYDEINELKTGENI